MCAEKAIPAGHLARWSDLIKTSGKCMASLGLCLTAFLNFFCKITIRWRNLRHHHTRFAEGGLLLFAMAYKTSGRAAIRQAKRAATHVKYVANSIEPKHVDYTSYTPTHLKFRSAALERLERRASNQNGALPRSLCAPRLCKKVPPPPWKTSQRPAKLVTCITTYQRFFFVCS